MQEYFQDIIEITQTAIKRDFSAEGFNDDEKGVTVIFGMGKHFLDLNFRPDGKMFLRYEVGIGSNYEVKFRELEIKTKEEFYSHLDILVDNSLQDLLNSDADDEQSLATTAK